MCLATRTVTKGVLNQVIDTDCLRSFCHFQVGSTEESNGVCFERAISFPGIIRSNF